MKRNNNNKFTLLKILFILISTVTASIIISSCQGNDCGCLTQSVQEYRCSPREVTITEFNAGVTYNNQPPNQGFNPVDAYSIHSFEFPLTNQSTGSLPNDKRFIASSGIDKIAIVKLPLRDFGIDLPYYFAILNDKPANQQISGDILVDSVHFGIEPEAFLRFRGSLSRLPEKESSESSKDFCSFLQSKFYDTDVNNVKKIKVDAVNFYRNNIKDYGEIDGSILRKYSNDSRVYVINILGQVVVDENGVINPEIIAPNSISYNQLSSSLGAITTQLGSVRTRLQAQIDKLGYNYIAVPVKIGDLFFYRAINGRDFIFTVINIDERDITPGVYKRRVSILFNEI